MVRYHHVLWRGFIYRVGLARWWVLLTGLLYCIVGYQNIKLQTQRGHRDQSKPNTGISDPKPYNVVRTTCGTGVRSLAYDRYLSVYMASTNHPVCLLEPGVEVDCHVAGFLTFRVIITWPPSPYLHKQSPVDHQTDKVSKVQIPSPVSSYQSPHSRVYT